MLPLMEEFIVDAVHYNHPLVIDNLVIVYKDLEPTVGGTCLLNGVNTPLITINSAIFYNVTKITQKMILYHELGHCVLGREHNDVNLPSGLPASIMNSWIIDDIYFIQHEDYYLNELFNP